MARTKVLVVGGYGAVGAHVTRTLTEWFPGRVVPAGRDLAKAGELADGAGAARVDVTDSPGFARVLAEHEIGTVVLCVEPPDVAIARTCLSQGVHLVDVGASYHLLAQVETLPVTDATAVLSVGV